MKTTHSPGIGILNVNEAQVMNCVWNGMETSTEIFQELYKGPDDYMVMTTVNSILMKLADKGLLKCKKAKQYRFTAKVSRDEMMAKVADRVNRVLGNDNVWLTLLGSDSKVTA